jgi:hypothetical protein
MTGSLFSLVFLMLTKLNIDSKTGLHKYTVGPIGQKALNKVVSHTDTTLTLPDATRHYQTLPDATRRYQMLTDIIRLSNPTVFFNKLGKFRVKKKSSK